MHERPEHRTREFAIMERIAVALESLVEFQRAADVRNLEHEAKAGEREANRVQLIADAMGPVMERSEERADARVARARVDLPAAKAPKRGGDA